MIILPSLQLFEALTTLSLLMADLSIVEH
jgi:hypothetical protein